MVYQILVLIHLLLRLEAFRILQTRALGIVSLSQTFRDGFLITDQADVAYWDEDSKHGMPWGRSVIGKYGGQESNDWDSTA